MRSLATLTTIVRFARSRAAFSLADQVVVSGTRFATTVMIGRLGSDSELGFYSLAFSLLVLFISCQESLISIPYTVFVKQLDKSGQAGFSASSLLQALVLNALAMASLILAWAGIGLLGGDSKVGQVMLVLGLFLPFILLREFARRFSFAHLNVAGALTLDTIVSVLQLAGLAMITWSGAMTAVGAYLATGIAAAVGVVGWYVFSRDRFHWQRDRIRNDWNRNRRFGKWVAAAHLVSVLHMYFAHWLLAWSFDERATGIYAACMIVVVLANPFILGISNLLSPKAAHAFAEGGANAVGQLVWRYTRLMIGALGLFAIAVSLVGGRLIVFIFDENYAGHDGSIAILALGTIAMGVNYSISSGLRAINRPETNFWAALVGVVVTVVASVGLVSTLQILGTTIGLVAGFVAMAIYRGFAFRAALEELTQHD